MNVALRKPMTLDQFLEWEDRQELRFEFDGFQSIARTDGTAAHAVFRRKGEDWVIDLLAGEDAMLDMPEIGIAIPISEIYRRVEFPAESGE